jgi:hypothetical protein
VTRLLRASATAGLVALAACGDDVTATLVTIEARPAVRSIDALDVTFANANATITESFDLRGVTLPATFSVTTGDREGILTMTAVGRNAFDDETARGTTSATIDRGEITEARLLLEPTDFTVNTLVAGSQQTIFFDGAGGRQIAANADGDFTIGFSDDCGMLDRCDVWGRTFDVRSTPQATAAAGGDGQFNFNRSSDVFGTDPAIAVGPDGNRVAVWWAIDRMFCTGFDPGGTALTPREVTLSTDGLTPQQPSIAAVEAGRYIVTWEENDNASASIIRAVLIDDACAAQVNAVTGTAASFPVSTVAPAGTVLDNPVVASRGLRMAFVWRSGATLRGRFTGDDGTFAAGEIAIAAEAGATLTNPHVAATDRGYLVSYTSSKDDRSFEVRTRPLNRGGSLDGAESVLATGVQGDNLTTQPAAAIARRSDGASLVTWYACGFASDPECSVVARVVRDTALPVGDVFHVNTTILGTQKDPAVAALTDSFAVVWSDDSGAPPDGDEFGIRARVLYPAFDDAVGVIGAPCGPSAACDDDLVCIAGSDDTARCHAACDPEDPPPACPGGGACTTSGDVSGCIF